MIKVIVFDFGNVLVGSDYTKFVNALASSSTLPAEEITALMLNSEIIKHLDTDLVNFDEFYRFFQDQCGLDMDIDTFQKHYLDCEVYDNVVGLVNTLKATGNYKLALLSNLSEISFENNFKRLSCADAFDVTILSYEYNYRKPHESLYEAVLEKFDCAPDEIVYLDDKKENLVPAQKLGMKTIHYTSYEELIQSLKELGVSF